MTNYLMKEKFLLTICSILTVIESLMQVSLAFILSGLVNGAMEKDQEKLFLFLLISIFYLMIQLLFTKINNYLKAVYIKRIETIYRKDLFQGIIRQSIRNYYSKAQGEYLSLLTHNTEDVVDSYIAGIFGILQMISAVVFAIASLIYIDIRMIVLSLLIGVVYMIGSSKLGEKLSHYKNSYYDELSKNIIKIKEMLAAFEVIKNNDLEKFAMDSFHRSSEELLEKKKIFTVKISDVNGYNLILGQGLIIGILAAVSFLVIREEIRIGELVAVAQLMSSLINPIGGLNETMNERNSSKIILEEQLNYIQKETKEKGNRIKEFNEDIKLCDVRFSYENQPILKDISLKFEKGKKYAVVGESGSGKSTLFRLILNYFDHYNGSLQIDGKEYRNLPEDALFDLISATQQETFLFDGTIKENITLFKEGSPSKILEAVELSGLGKVLKKNRICLDTKIRECGQTLSGGEKQRIAIARMLFRESPILLLDEITSSLDRNTSNEILEKILKLKDKTCICITHKLKQENSELYDEIIEIRDGKIINVIKNKEILSA